MEAEGGRIPVTGNATDEVLWDQLRLWAPQGTHVALNRAPTGASALVPDEGLVLDALALGPVRSGDVIRLCGPDAARIVLDQTQWPYAIPSPWTMRLPPCPS